jgi:hypothetical protein
LVGADEYHEHSGKRDKDIKKREAEAVEWRIKVVVCSISTSNQ